MHHPRPSWGLAAKTIGVVIAVTLTSLLALAAVLVTPVSPAVRASLFHGALVDQGPSPTLAPGGSASYTMRFRNTGVAPWKRGVPGMQVNLAVSSESASTDFAELQAGWLSADRVSTTTEELVLPGAIGTFTFSVRAPLTPGIYRLPLRLVVDGLVWLEDGPVAVTIASDLGFHSQFVDQSDHPLLHPGDTSTLTLRFRNVGARTWTRGVAGEQVNLGIAGDDASLGGLGVGWPSADRVALQSEATVPPGGIGTFAFRVRAPASSGTYALRVRPVVDGITWMEDDGVVSLISVVSGNDPSFSAQRTTNVATATAVALTSSATVTPATVAPGSSVSINATFSSHTALTSNVGIEVHAPNGGSIVYSKWYENEHFSADQPRSYATTWLVPTSVSPGTYTVSLRMYAPSWKSLYSATDSAAAFTVSAPAATAAPTAAPATPVPTAPPSAAGTATTAPTATRPSATSGPTATPAPSATASAAPSFTLGALVTPSSASPGGSVAITATVTSSTATTALVDIEVWAAGGASAAYQVWFDDQSFGGGQQRSYPATWQLPTTAIAGGYTVKVAVFSPGWIALYSTVDAATFSVVAVAPTPTPIATPAPTVAPTAPPTATPAATATAAPSFTLTAAVSPASVAAGGAVSIAANVVSATAVSGVIVDIYVFAPGGATQLGEVFYLDQAFVAGQQRSYPMSWTVPTGAAAGTYIVKLGVASAAWAQTLAWNAQAATFSVTAAAATATPAPTPAPTVAPTPAPTPAPTAAPTPAGAASPLHVQGNRLVNALGQAVVLRGVARSGTESACVLNGGWGFAEGPMDQASVNALKSWKINFVRMPLNEDCWLQINGVNPTWSGAAYQQAIKSYVNLLNQNGLYVILDLHWNAPGTTLATHQQPMADLDHAPAFWTSVANAFKGNNAAILELYNEPYPDNQQDSVAAWTCWRDGGTCSGVPFPAAGMQTLVNAVRATGATNVLALGGVGYADYLSRWLAYRPSDPLNNLAAAWHVYNFNACNNQSCWDTYGAPLIAQVPVLVTETGTDTCDSVWWNGYLSWLDARSTSYLAWTWDNWGTACSALSLITDYTGTPTQYGQLFRAHLALLP